MGAGTELLDVASADGTHVGVERVGSGPPVIAVHGTTADRSRWEPVRDQLAERFTLYLLDRRGRGSSLRESRIAYSLGLEAGDVHAVGELVGEPFFYLGHSYGALVGLEVLARSDRVAKAFLYEPPFAADGLEIAPASFTEAYAALIADDRRDEALDLFYTQVLHVDPAPLHGLPIWQARKAAAHTLVREFDTAAAFVPDAARYAGANVPTLILLGTESPPVFSAAAHAAADALPDARIVPAVGQGHVMIDADPEGFVELVSDFFGG